jgi:hypothetical protein
MFGSRREDTGPSISGTQVSTEANDAANDAARDRVTRLERRQTCLIEQHAIKEAE